MKHSFITSNRKKEQEKQIDWRLKILWNVSRMTLTELTEMSWYEWFIMAIRRLSKTMMLINEKLPNMMRPQNLVNSLIPVSSKLSRSIRPKAAQNKVCVVSHKLNKDEFNPVNVDVFVTETYLANFLYARQWFISITICSLLS